MTSVNSAFLWSDRTILFINAFISFVIILAPVLLIGAESHDQCIISPEIEEKIASLVSKGDIPSLQAVVVHKDKTVWFRSFGENTSAEHVYMIGSVQKVFTATAVVQLYERGLIDFDDDISTYVPFMVRHPDYPDKPITIRMLLIHKSGLEILDYQFAWETECVAYPEYRLTCKPELLELSMAEYLSESFTPEGSNYSPAAWIAEPETEYNYSVAAYVLLRYLIAQVSGQTYPEYMKENFFDSLEMENAGFTVEEFENRHTIPHTRVNNVNTVIKHWNGTSHFMRMTTEDLAKFMISHMNEGRYKDYQMLKPASIELMRKITSKEKSLFNPDSKLINTGFGLGLRCYKNGWIGLGGSVPGYLCYWRFHPSRSTGYAFLVNVNAILGGSDNYQSVNNSVKPIKELLESELGPTFTFGLKLFIIFLAISITTLTFAFFRRRSLKSKAK